VAVLDVSPDRVTPRFDVVGLACLLGKLRTVRLPDLRHDLPAQGRNPDASRYEQEQEKLKSFFRRKNPSYTHSPPPETPIPTRAARLIGLPGRDYLHGLQATKVLQWITITGWDHTEMHHQSRVLE
jgi:hypothetical protein